MGTIWRSFRWPRFLKNSAHEKRSKCVSVSQFTLDKPVAKLAMLAGSFTASNMEFNLMAQCPLTKLWAMIPSALFSLRLVLVNMCPEQSLLIWSHLSLMKYELEPIVNCFTQ